MTQSSLPPECHLTFTPIESSLGGLLIGLSAAVLLLCYGRVLGFSGILAQSTIPFASAKLPAMWRLLLVLGLVVGGIICTAIPASGFPYATIDVNEGIYVLGGVAVGLGASVGNGCTSGHGICGLGRLSPRSFVAVMTFMASAFVTAIVTIYGVGGVRCSHVSWIAWPPTVPSQPAALLLAALVPAAATLCLVVAATFAARGGAATTRGCTLATLLAQLIPLAVGITSGIGLVLAGMLNQHKVRGFLNLTGQWDPSLAFVMGAGAGVSLVAHRVANRMGKPLLLDEFAYPPSREFGTDGTVSCPARQQGDDKVAVTGGTRREGSSRRGGRADPQLIGGAIIFGIGWGITGICPGPSIVGLSSPIVALAQGDASAYGAPWRFPVFLLASTIGLAVGERIKARAAASAAVDAAPPS